MDKRELIEGVKMDECLVCDQPCNGLYCNDHKKVLRIKNGYPEKKVKKEVHHLANKPCLECGKVFSPKRWDQFNCPECRKKVRIKFGRLSR